MPLFTPDSVLSDPEVKTAYENNANTNEFSDAEESKLAGIATSANNYSHPNHTGDVTSTGDGATVIANNVVTLAKMADIATASILGRNTAATGNPEVLSASIVRTILNVEDGAAADQNASEVAVTHSSVNYTADSGFVEGHFSGLDTALAKASTVNAIANSSFNINQRGVAGTVVLAANTYGHDRWRAGASGCTYTFSTVENVTTITISAGSLQQAIDGKNLFTDTCTLSWTGTAQGKIGTGAYSSSGVTGAVTGGTQINVEFNTGTLTQVQFERGSTANNFIQQGIIADLHECSYYYQQGDAFNQGGAVYASGFVADGGITFSRILRSVPATVLANPTASNFTTNTTTELNDRITAAKAGFSFIYRQGTTAEGDIGYLAYSWTADSEIYT